MRHAAYAVGGVIVGGLVGGPFGAMLGGMAGSAVGWKNADEYSSMIGTLNNMTDEEKARLFDRVQEVCTKAWKCNLPMKFTCKFHGKFTCECIFMCKFT